jgi:plasmid maintenance system antidote protein VapI
MDQADLIGELDNYTKFMLLRRKLGKLDKELAYELGISTRAMTERVTGRAEVKNETILALKYLLEKKNEI